MNYSNLHVITVLTFIKTNAFYLVTLTQAINSTIPMCQNLKQFLSMFDLKQLIGEPTRVTDTSATILDLLLVSEPSKICQSGVTNLGLSDHMLTYCTRKVKISFVYQHNYVNLRSLKNYTKEAF